VPKQSHRDSQSQLNSIFHSNRCFVAGPPARLLGICFVQSHYSTQPQRVAKSELSWTFKWFFRASLNDRRLLDPSVLAPRLASSTSTKENKDGDGNGNLGQWSSLLKCRRALKRAGPLPCSAPSYNRFLFIFVSSLESQNPPCVAL
jgi:hypothetical protein